jgi:hypothetical protein
MRRYTNYSARPLPKLAPYATYATGASSSRRRRHPRCPTLHPSSFSSSDDDEADSGRVISPDDFVKDPAEEDHALAEAVAQTAAEASAQHTAEEAGRLAALHAVEAFQEREAAHALRLAEAPRILLPLPRRVY